MDAVPRAAASVWGPGGFPLAGRRRVWYTGGEVIAMEFRQEPGRIFATGEDGRLLAEVTFPEREGAAESQPAES